MLLSLNCGARLAGQPCSLCERLDAIRNARIVAYGAMMYWAAVVLRGPRFLRCEIVGKSQREERAWKCTQLARATSAYLRTGGAP